MIDSVFVQKYPYPRNSVTPKNLNDAVCYFISRDTHLYQTANDAGFQSMLALILSAFLWTIKHWPLIKFPSHMVKKEIELAVS